MALDHGVPSPATGLVTVALHTDAIAVYVQAVCVTKALRVAAANRFELMGWADDEWVTAAASAELHERAMVNSITIARPEELANELEEDDPADVAEG